MYIIIITIHYLRFPGTFPFVDGTRRAYLYQIQHLGRYNIIWNIISFRFRRLEIFSTFFLSTTAPPRPSWLVGVTGVGRRGVESLREIRSDLEQFVHATSALHTYRIVSVPTYLYWNRESRLLIIRSFNLM